MSRIVHLPSSEENGDVIHVARAISAAYEEQGETDRAAAFQEKVIEFVQSNQYDQLFFAFADEYETIMSVAKDKKGQPKVERVEAYFSTLNYLLSFMTSIKKLESAITRLVELLMESGDFAQSRLRLLMGCYNSIPVTPQTVQLSKLQFFGVIRYSAEHNLFDELIPYFEHFSNWVENWGLAEEEARETKRELYYLIATQIPLISADRLQGSHLSKDLAYRWINNYLNQETEVNEGSVELISKFVEEIIKLPSLYEVEQVLEIPLIQKARKTVPKVEKYVELLNLFVSGSMKDLVAFKKANESLIGGELDGSWDMLFRKMRVLTLCSVCLENGAEIPLEKIAAELDTPNIEDVIVDAVAQNVLCARIDEVNQVLRVTQVLRRQFQLAQWKELDGLLDSWLDKIQKVRELHRCGEGAITN